MNDSPLSPETVAQMVADREAGTPGPWHFDGPVWNQIIWTYGENRLCFMAHSNGLNDDRDIANARRITRLPDLEAAYLTIAARVITLAAENATLRAENEELDFLRHEGGPDSVAAMEIELATLRAERDAWTKIDVARDVDFATLRTSEAAALERITELEALLAASTHSPRLPE